MKNLFTQVGGGGALGSKGSEDAVLGSRENGGISLKGSQGADFALEDKGTLGSNVSEDALLGLKSLSARHSETPKAGSESVKKCAFTLAEVLITLGIIGVVAALTIPTLMQNLNRRDTVAKVRSAYSTFSNAFALAEVHHGNASTWDGVTNQDVFSDASEYTQYGLTATDWVGFKYILDGIKTIKVCGHGQDTSCFPALVYNGTSYFVPFIFPNGTSAYIYRSPEGCSGGDKCGALTINTLKADMQSQSKLGRDQFEFYIFPGKILPKGYDDINSEHCNANIIGTPEAYACTAYIIREGNMDYLDE